MSDESIDLLFRVLLGPKDTAKFESGMIGIEEALDGVDKKAIDLTETFIGKLDASLKELDIQFAKTTKIINSMKTVSRDVGQISQTMFVAGAAVVGGMYLAAKNEADHIKDAGGEVDAVTARWFAANERITASQQKIGAAAEQAVVPLLEKAAGLAEKAADFVDKNPELVSAALNLGLWTAGIGAIGVAVSKGIKLAADIKYLAASAQYTIDVGIMQSSAATMLEAALVMQGNGIAGSEVGGLGTAAQAVLPIGEGGAAAGGAAAGAGGVAATVGSAALLIAAPVIGAEIAKFFGNAIQKATGQKELSWGDIGTTAKQALDLPGKELLLFLKNTGVVSTETAKELNNLHNSLLGLGDSTSDAQKAAEALATLGSVAKDEASATEKMTGLARDNAKAERKYEDDREAIFTDSARAMDDANRKLSKSLSDISESLASNISKIKSDLTSSLADLASKFADDNTKAEQEYQQKRAEIAASGAEEILKIHEQEKKDLENLEKEHSRTVASLTESRDAFGLIKENQDYADKQAEIKKNAQESIAQARANTQAQLKEAAQHYVLERAQRLAEYQKQQADARAKAAADIAAAQAKAVEDKKRAAESAAQEKADIERKQAEKLADLKKSYDQERSERITAIYNEITDLKGALNAEMLMRRTYQNQILADATSHMQAMAAVQSGGTSTPIHDYSGYAYTGMYAMAQNGQSQYVLSGSATRAAEQMVGGQLNQQVLLAGLAGQGRSGTQYIDQSSYSGMTVADVRRVRELSRQEALSVMREIEKDY